MDVPTFQLVLASLLFVFVALKLCSNTQKTKRNTSKLPLPPGPIKLPILGNLLHLAGSLPHRALTDLAKKYGGVMYLQLGQLSTLVISSPEAAKEMLKTHDVEFANRPYLFSASILFYNSDVAFSMGVGPKWRQLRKICVMELLSPKRVTAFRCVREQEGAKLVEMIKSCAAAGLPFNVGEQVFLLTNTITCRAAFGEECKEVQVFMKLAEELNECIGGYSLSDLFPSFRLLRLISGMEYRVKRVGRGIDRILESVISDHRKNYKKDKGQNDDLVDVLLDIQRNGNLEIPLTDDAIKGTLLDIFVAGSDTSSATVEWAMSEMIRSPRVSKKAQEEVRKVFDKEGKVMETGLSELHYLKMVIKETLRLHTPGPLLIPRENENPCEFMGYLVPAKTKVLINAWALGRHPKSWTEPDKFYPERFLDSPIDYKGNHYELIPFGAGRRMCPGIAFGIANAELPLANLLYYFDWKLPGGVGPEELEMSECYGSTVKRKNHLLLVPAAYHTI